jgi:hypothetical protein
LHMRCACATYRHAQIGMRKSIFSLFICMRKLLKVPEKLRAEQALKQAWLATQQMPCQDVVATILNYLHAHIFTRARVSVKRDLLSVKRDLLSAKRDLI